MTSFRYAFCGNRFFVLESMLAHGLNVVAIAAVAGSYLERALQERSIAYTALANKTAFLEWLRAQEMDFLVSNGCPWRVPVSDISARCINIHPSFLPDLKGADPVPGAILFGRDSGATCHVMDEDFDSGDIIAQIRIPYDPNWGALTLYPLCFSAEKNAFEQALAKNFVVSHHQQPDGSEVYYSFKEADLWIDFAQDAATIRRRVLAFNNPKKLARFSYKGHIVRLKDASILPLTNTAANLRDNEVLTIDQSMLAIKKSDALLQLYYMDNDGKHIVAGDILGA